VAVRFPACARKSRLRFAVSGPHSLPRWRNARAPMRCSQSSRFTRPLRHLAGWGFPEGKHHSTAIDSAHVQRENIVIPALRKKRATSGTCLASKLHLARGPTRPILPDRVALTQPSPRHTKRCVLAEPSYNTKKCGWGQTDSRRKWIPRGLKTRACAAGSTGCSARYGLRPHTLLEPGKGRDRDRRGQHRSHRWPIFPSADRP
jgi:hypothetical protein